MGAWGQCNWKGQPFWGHGASLNVRGEKWLEEKVMAEGNMNVGFGGRIIKCEIVKINN